MGYELELLYAFLNGRGLTPGIQRAIDENNVTDLMWEMEAAIIKNKYTNPRSENESQTKE